MRNISICFAIVMISIGCSRNFDYDNDKASLISELNQLAALNKTDLYNSFSNKCLTPNPFGIVSEKVTESLEEFTKSVTSNQIKNEDLKSILISSLISKLPSELTTMSQEGYTDIEGAIYSLISESLIKDDMQSFITRSKLIEDIVYKSNFLNKNSKDRILVYCAALRSTVTFIHEISIQSKKPETWEECFIRKQRDIGFFEGLACAISWPLCLGGMAADCLVEVTF